MSDSQEKSDDLIAELARLMASNANGVESEVKPAPRIAPIGEAPAGSTAAFPSPLRIPGMSPPVQAQPRPASDSTPGFGNVSPLRIPGMDRPVPSAPVAAEPARVEPAFEAPQRTSATETAAPVQRDEPVLDAPAPAPAAPSRPFTLRPIEVSPPQVTEPAVEAREPAVTADAAPVADEPVAEAPGAAAPHVMRAPESVEEPVVPEPRPVFSRRPIPVPMANAQPVANEAPDVIPMPAPASPVASASPVSGSDNPDSFDFDFGFNGKAPEQAAEQATPPAPVASSETPDGFDPIADLIAAELESTPPPPAAEARPAAPRPGITPAGATQNAANPLVPRPASQPAVRLPAFAPMKTINPVPQPAAGPAPSAQMGTDQPRAAAPAPKPIPRPEPTPATPTSKPADLDPMTEIENLIGEAVRVNLSTPAPQAPAMETVHVESAAPAPQPAPVVPPLVGQFAPRRAGLKDDPVQSAEDAILAAAQATGAPVGRIDTVEPQVAPRAKPQRAKPAKPVRAAKPVREPTTRRPSGLSGSMRQVAGIAVAGTLLLAAAFGLFWVLGMGRSDPANAPVLTADATPAKQAAVPPAAAPQASGSVVFNEIDGKQVADADETLVSRDETEGTDVSQVITPAVPETSGEEGGLANIKVRTVTVRPDGTIVSGDEAVAGSEALPVDRPNVPDVPGDEGPASDLLTGVAGSEGTDATTTAATGSAASENDPIASAIAEADNAPDSPAVVASLTDPAATTSNATADVGPAAPIDPSIVAPTPMPRPADRGTMVGSPTRGAAAEDLGADEAPTQVASTSDAGAGIPAAAYAQISSQRSESDAQTELRQAQSRFGNLFGGRQLEIQRADLGQRGIYYRVRVPAGSFQEATRICASVEANGGECFPVNG